jgi:general secretion pathway protein G
MRTARPQERGFTLIEIIVVLAMVAVLAAVTAPAIIKHIDDSKEQRAKKDVEAIATALTGFYTDTGRWPTDSDTNKSINDNEVRRLESPGTRPTEVSGAGWLSLSGLDTMDNQLILNTPAGIVGRAYAQNGENRWNGPYLNGVKSDPWGFMYLVNVGALWPGQTGPVWVISAGPNNVLDTATSDLTVQGDDIGYLLRR